VRVAILTVGDELLSGDTVNTNASWLAGEITDRGGTVRRITTVPDERDLIAAFVREWSTEFDAVVVTGGLGGTPDDVTMAAVADGLDEDLVVHEAERERMVERARRFREENPDLASDYEFDTDYDEAASLPEGARALHTDAGWSPGCVAGNVYVLPGIPEEMQAMFALVAEEFGGDVVSGTLYTPAPEGALGGLLREFRETFDLSVGSYPGQGETPGRLKVTGEDPEAVREGVAWLRERVETVENPDG
jgi:molybdenum cofactor synthesis domain-containing protein